MERSNTGSDGGMPAGGVPSSDARERERERWDEGKTVKERVYETALTLDEPMTVAVIAERARSTPESARTHLRWFAEMGIVERIDGRPEQYRKNEAYFEWKRADELRREQSPEELEQRLRALIERDRSYQERYDATGPEQVSAFEHADRNSGKFEPVWTEINDWYTV
ncbi:MAG: helix-turn-helix transcriptional regulator, partial [Euryarchaeota archaeon]|nr:helix-turn-helix transcriptional regulator [Euryarchaeota archaeon]